MFLILHFLHINIYILLSDPDSPENGFYANIHHYFEITTIKYNIACIFIMSLPAESPVEVETCLEDF